MGLSGLAGCGRRGYKRAMYRSAWSLTCHPARGGRVRGQQSPDVVSIYSVYIHIYWTVVFYYEG